MALYYDTLISIDTCLQQGSSPDWSLIDCRFDLTDKTWGEAAYREGHIPGAYYAGLENDLSAPQTADSGRHPLPDWQAFADRMTGWGVHRDTQVVVYDQGGGAFAARLWWLLRSVGHKRAAVLDGGWAGWQSAGGAESKNLPAPRMQPAELSPGSGWVTTVDVEKNLNSKGFVLVDARSRERFTGRKEPIDPIAGHIPGARNFPFEQNLDAHGVFHPPAVLREVWLSCLRDTPPASVVHMCGSGVTACHNLLAMEMAGLHGSRLYAGSWSEWIRGDRSIATGKD
jgi:thiosulfate/3-mercaptopyruvate sulfurtransferase